MKKITIPSYFRKKANCLLKNNLKMKLSILLMVFSVLQVFPNKGYSQKKVSFNLKNVTIKEVFNEIQNQTDFKFLYRNTVVNVNSRISLKAKNKTTLKVLDRLFRNTQIEYQIIEKQIVLTKKELKLPLIKAVSNDQAKEIKGRVTDSDGQPLPGASIVEKGTANGIQSDFDGKYSIEVEHGQTLVFTFLGYQTQTVKVGVSPVIDVVLHEQGLQLDMISLVGSRNPERTIIETPVPVDVIDVNNILASSPQINLNQILNYVAPSFTSNVQSIQDGTDHIDPASLRGLGPDQVLVLINGKRRHTTSLINIVQSFGRGNVGTDLNSIPATSVEKIEVLRDGAAAQYGSDAIAGVINIVLKKATDKLSINLTTGANMSQYSNDQTGGVDGEKYNLSANYGISLGKKGGYVNFTGDFDVRDFFGRMKEWEGSIFNGYNTIERLAQSKGENIANLTPADVKRLAPEAGFTSEQLDKILTATDTDIKDYKSEIISFDNTK